MPENNKVYRAELVENTNIFDNVQFQSNETITKDWDDIINDLKECGATTTIPLGSTFKRNLTGDIEITINTNNISRNEFFETCTLKFGNNNVRKIGSSTITFIRKMSDETIAKFNVHIQQQCNMMNTRK